MITPALVVSLLVMFVPSIALVVLVVLYYRIWSKYQSTKQEQEWSRHGATNLAEDMLQKAHQQAEKLVEQGEAKAEHILAETSSFSTSTEKKLDQALEHVTQDQVDQYQKLLHQSQTYLAGELERVAQQLKQSSTSTLKDVQERVQDQLHVALNEVAQQVTSQHQAQQKLLEKYQQQLENEVKTRVAKILTESIAEVTGKALTSEDQTRIVLEVLAKAAERHSFLSEDQAAKTNKLADGST